MQPKRKTMYDINRKKIPEFYIPLDTLAVEFASKKGSACLIRRVRALFGTELEQTIYADTGGLPKKNIIRLHGNKNGSPCKIQNVMRVMEYCDAMRGQRGFTGSNIFVCPVTAAYFSACSKCSNKVSLVKKYLDIAHTENNEPVDIDVVQFCKETCAFRTNSYLSMLTRIGTESKNVNLKDDGTINVSRSLLAVLLSFSQVT